MAIKIGNREVIHSASMIIPSKEVASTSFTVDSWEIRTKFSFIKDQEKNSKGAIKVEITEGFPHIKLVNWENSLGTATVEPIQLGETKDGYIISFMLTHWLVGTTNKLDAQFLKEKPNDTKK